MKLKLYASRNSRIVRKWLSGTVHPNGFIKSDILNPDGIEKTIILIKNFENGKIQTIVRISMVPIDAPSNIPTIPIPQGYKFYREMWEIIYLYQKREDEIKIISENVNNINRDLNEKIDFLLSIGYFGVSPYGPWEGTESVNDNPSKMKSRIYQYNIFFNKRDIQKIEISYLLIEEFQRREDGTIDEEKLPKEVSYFGSEKKQEYYYHIPLTGIIKKFFNLK